MPKSNERRRVTYTSAQLGAFIIGIDIFAVCLVGIAFHHVRFQTWSLSAEYASLVMAAVLLTSFSSFVTLGKAPSISTASLVAQGATGWIVVWMLLVVWLAAIGATSTYSRIFLFGWGAVTLATVCVFRLLAARTVHQVRYVRFKAKRVLLIGRGPVSSEMRRRVLRSGWLGYTVAKSIDSTDREQIKQLGESGEFHEIWISLGIERMNQLPNVLSALHQSTATVRLVLDLFTYRVASNRVSTIAGFPTVDVSEAPLIGGNAVLKTIEDYVIALIILILISPLLFIIAVAVKITSPGPILYKQRRHGWNGKVILVYKFRSMKVHSEPSGVVTQARKNDPRLTPIGDFLRRTSLDELPQFINVLQGRMSVVGPRPHATEHNLYYKEVIPRYMLRHRVKPGITGLAQVSGLRGETDTVDKMRARVEHDLIYLETWSIWLDFKIIFLTIFRAWSDRNAY